MQNIVLAKTKQLLLGLAVSKAADSKGLALLVHLPHGIFIPAAILMAIDGASPEKVQIQTCDARGCYAGVPLPSDKVAALSKGKNLNITFQDLKKQKIAVPVPLNGVSLRRSSLPRATAIVDFPAAERPVSHIRNGEGPLTAS